MTETECDSSNVGELEQIHECGTEAGNQGMLADWREHALVWPQFDWEENPPCEEVPPPLFAF